MVNKAEGVIGIWCNEIVARSSETEAADGDIAKTGLRMHAHGLRAGQTSEKQRENVQAQ